MTMHFKNTTDRADFILAVALVIGALVLAAFSWWLPSTLNAPMTAQMVGTITDISNVYGNYRVGLTIDDGVSKYTFITEEYEELPVKPEVGEYVALKYEISSMHEVRYLEVRGEDGEKDVLYSTVNPNARVIRNRQLMAFVIFGVYFAVVVGIYLLKTKKGGRRAAPAL
jgi:hypothetical protein